MLVADVAIELHLTREQVLEMDMDFLDDLRRAWEVFPPVRKLMAAIHGYKPPARPSTDYSELLAMFPSGVIR